MIQQQYKCSQCGAIVYYGVKFCSYCGRQLSWVKSRQLHKNWFKKHLNLTYFTCLTPALYLLIVLGFIENSATGYIIWIIILMLSSLWILRQKGRSLGFLLLVFFVTIVGIPTVFCLSNQKGYRDNAK